MQTTEKTVLQNDGQVDRWIDRHMDKRTDRAELIGTIAKAMGQKLNTLTTS